MSSTNGTAKSVRPGAPVAVNGECGLDRDDDAERGLLGALSWEPHRWAEVSHVVRPESFFDPIHREYFEILSVACREGRAPDKDLVFSMVAANGHPRASELQALFFQIRENDATGANAPWYADRIYKAHQRRESALLISKAQLDLSSGMPQDVVLRRLVAAAEQQQAQANPTARMFTAYTPAQLAALDLHSDFLIKGVMVRRQNGVVGGIYKSLKTSVTADAAVSLVTATPFLGRFEVPTAAKVVLMSAESGLAKLRGTMRRVCRARGLDFDKLGPSLVTSPHVPRLGDELDHEALRNTARAHEGEVIFIDPAGRALASIGNDASNMFRMYPLLAQVDEIAEQTGTTIMLVHHCRKGSGITFEPPELQHLSMSGFAEWARQWILLGPRATWNPDTGEHRLWINYGGSEGHSGLLGLNVREGRHDDPGGQVWDVGLLTLEEIKAGMADARETAKEEKRQTSLQLNMRKVVSALTRAATPQTVSALAPLAGLSDGKCKEAVAALFEASELEPCQVEVGRNNRLVDAVRLRSGSTLEDDK